MLLRENKILSFSDAFSVSLFLFSPYVIHTIPSLPSSCHIIPFISLHFYLSSHTDPEHPIRLLALTSGSKPCAHTACRAISFFR